MSPRRVRILFRTAALFNWSAVVLFLPAFGVAERLGLHTAPTGTPFEHIGIAAIGLFGVGYWMVAASPEQNRGIAQLGLAGKVLVIALILGHYMAHDVNLRLTLVVCGDVVYSALFAWYLTTGNPRRQKPTIEGATPAQLS